MKFEEEINRVQENYAWSGTKQAKNVRQRVFFSKKNKAGEDFFRIKKGGPR